MLIECRKGSVTLICEEHIVTAAQKVVFSDFSLIPRNLSSVQRKLTGPLVKRNLHMYIAWQQKAVILCHKTLNFRSAFELYVLWLVGYRLSFVRNHRAERNVQCYSDKSFYFGLSKTAWDQWNFDTSFAPRPFHLQETRPVVVDLCEKKCRIWPGLKHYSGGFVCLRRWQVSVGKSCFGMTCWWEVAFSGKCFCSSIGDAMQWHDFETTCTVHVHVK